MGMALLLTDLIFCTASFTLDLPNEYDSVGNQNRMSDE